MATYDFSVELAAFAAKKQELLGVCLGKFAAFKGNEFLGVFDSYQSAFNAGVEKLGNVPFLIKHVTPEEPEASVPALCLGLIHAGT